MSNPDRKVSDIDYLAVVIPVSIFFLLLTIALFLLRDKIPFFTLVLWIGLPIVTYIVCSLVNILSQYMSCRKIDAGRAFLGGLPSIGTILIGLGIASISVCRIPVASVFTPMIVGKSIDITTKNTNTTLNSLKNSSSKECCTPRITLENVENRYPIISGISYGFYVLFATLFGLTIGNGISSIC